jgi:hypothetical protein
MTTGTNPFTSASISGYNSSPPDDDGSQTSANRVSWSKHKTKLADPIKTLAESDISNTSAAFAKTINTDDGVKNLLDGSLAFGADELTISSGSVTADRSAHTIDTESDAATDDLSNIVGTSVYTGAILHLYAANSARQVVVKNEATGAGEIHTKDKADIVLSTEYPLILRYNGTDWYEIAHPAPSASKARNLIDNGAMAVDQRSGETRTGIGASAAYHIDRWKYSPSGSPTGRFTLANTAEASLGVPGSIKCTVTTEDAALAANALYMWETMVEAQNLQHLNYGQSDAKDITVSFWANAPAGNYTFKVLSQDGNRTWVTAFALAGSGLEKTTITVPGDTSGTITNDNGRGLQFSWTMAGGSDFQGGTTDAWTAEANNTYAAGNNVNMFDTNTNVFQLAKVQVEVGSVATEFEHEDIGTTWLRCCRYAYVPGGLGGASANEIVGQGIAASTTRATIKVYPPVEMRADISVTATAGDWKLNDTSTAIDVTAISASVSGKRSIRLNVDVAAGLTQYRDCELIADGTANRVIVFSADL